MSRYVVLVDGKKGAHGVTIPDLPGCTAMGRNVEEALANAAAAMLDWAEVTEESGGGIRRPRPVEAVAADTEVRAALARGAALASVPLIGS